MEKPTYYILQGQETKGPFTVSQLCSMWSSGELARDTVYSEEGYDKWLRLDILMEVDQSARTVAFEQTQTNRRSQSSYVQRPSWIHRMESVGGTIEVYEDKVVIERAGVLSFLSHGLKGAKSIPFYSISAIQFKKAGFTSGYLQFTIPGGYENTGGVFDAAGDENTFMFSEGDTNNQLAEIIKNYIETRVQEIRAPKPTTPVSSSSIADEIKKLADLKAQGVLTDTEFQAAKTRLLGG